MARQSEYRQRVTLPRLQELGLGDGFPEYARYAAEAAAAGVARPPEDDSDWDMNWATGMVSEAIKELDEGSVEEWEARLRAAKDEVLGPGYPAVPFDPDWLSWRDGTVPRLAAAIADDQRFDQLPLQADALADAGCASPLILDHLRGPGPHARGCWALDLVAGRR